METKVQNGVCSISWPGKGKINTKQLLHSSVRYLAHPRQELPLLPALTGNYLRDKQPPRPPPNPGQADNGPLPAAPRGCKIGKHKAIFNVLFVYQRQLHGPEKWYRLWEVALIFFFLTCSDKATFFKLSEKPKKQHSPRVNSCSACPSALQGMLSQVCLGEQSPTALCWPGASPCPQVPPPPTSRAQGNGIKPRDPKGERRTIETESSRGGRGKEGGDVGSERLGVPTGEGSRKPALGDWCDGWGPLLWAVPNTKG